MIERMVVEYLANALWQIPLLAGGAWLLLAAGKASPRIQHGVWLAVLAAAVLLPLHGMAPSGTVVLRTGSIAASSREQLADAAVGAAANSTWSAETATQQSGLQHIETAVHPRKLIVSLRTARWMVGLYAGVMIFGLYRVVRAWREARRLVAESREISLAGEHTVVLEDYGRRLRIRLPQVRESVAISSPMIVGAAVPVLLLPEQFAGYARDEMAAALLHELAHVKRRDYLVNVLCQIVALPVVWHPATHWVQGRVRRTREMACDDMAAEEMQSETGYARCLLTLARGMLEPQAFEPHSIGIGLFSNNVLEERVMRLMETKTAMRLRTKVVRVAGGAAAMAAATVMAMMFHVKPTLAASNAGTLQAEAVNRQTPAAPPVPAPPPVPPTAPVAPLAPIAPVPSAAPIPPAPPTAAPPAPVSPDNAGDADNMDSESFAIVNGKRRPLTPEEKRRLDAEKLKADRARTRAMAILNTLEFKREIADAQAQAAAAMDYVNSPEFKRQMDEVRKKNENLKIEMPKIDLDLRKAMAQINSPEFRRQMQQVQQMNMVEVQKMMNEDMLKLNESLHLNVTIK